MQRPEDMPPIHTQVDLCQTWRALMGKLGFGHRYLWFLFLEEDGRLIPQVNQVEAVPAAPKPGDCAGAIGFFRRVMNDMDDGLSVAVLWSRPGGAATTPDDLRWAKGLTEEARRQGVRMWPVHLANDYDLRVFTPDELLAA
ncbi:MAG: hypothetical protein JJE02_04065 [Propionibacteriales bacterium]|nr:hypothetical protein [Propionibacteriales bacterium]